jgi:signal transduction histidine kinase
MATTEIGDRRSRAFTPSDPLAIRLYSAAISGSFLGLFLLAWNRSETHFSSNFKAVICFTLAAQAGELLRIQLWKDMSFSLALPVLLAAGMILPAGEAAAVAFVGSIDVGEMRRRLPASRIIFNSAEIGLSVIAASSVFHLLDDGSLHWPLVIAPALAAFVTDAVVNAALVAWPASYLEDVSPVDAVRRMFGPNAEARLRYIAIGMMAPLIATVWQSAGAIGLAAFFLPLMLAWSAFRHAEELVAASRQIESKNESLLQALEDVASERRDERLALAGELHDQVLPALFQVDLMAQVLKQDLADGRLLVLEEDLPPLVEGVKRATRATRELTNDLRESSLGPGGLVAAIRSIARDLEAFSTTRFDLDLMNVSAEETSQLVAYQVCREAMINASKHSRSEWVTVRLAGDPAGFRLVVSDEGVGFSTRVASRPLHFGLQLMSERVEAAGGHLTVDSMLGRGTTVSLILPR